MHNISRLFHINEHDLNGTLDGLGSDQSSILVVVRQATKPMSLALKELSDKRTIRSEQVDVLVIQYNNTMKRYGQYVARSIEVNLLRPAL